MRIPPTDLGLCRAVAARASCDARTVYRVLRGKQTRGLVAGRILRALRDMDIPLPRTARKLSLVPCPSHEGGTTKPAA